MTETTDPTRGDGSDDPEPPQPAGTQIDTKPPQPKPNVMVFLLGFIVGLVVGAGAMATCGGGMMAGRQAASTPTERPAPPNVPTPTQPPTPQ